MKWTDKVRDSMGSWFVAFAVGHDILTEERALVWVTRWKKVIKAINNFVKPILVFYVFYNIYKLVGIEIVVIALLVSVVIVLGKIYSQLKGEES
jgi:hypothetical protein